VSERKRGALPADAGGDAGAAGATVAAEGAGRASSVPEASVRVREAATRGARSPAAVPFGRSRGGSDGVPVIAGGRASGTARPGAVAFGDGVADGRTTVGGEGLVSATGGVGDDGGRAAVVAPDGDGGGAGAEAGGMGAGAAAGGVGVGGATGAADSGFAGETADATTVSPTSARGPRRSVTPTATFATITTPAT
jgi:hypothetical protein